MKNSHILPGVRIPRTLVLGKGERARGKFVFVLKNVLKLSHRNAEFYKISEGVLG